MPLLKVTTRWTGFSGAPGYSNMWFESEFATGVNASEHGAAVRAFWQSISIHIPSGVQLQVLPDVEVVDAPTGRLQDVVAAATPPTVVNGGGSGAYSAPSGAVLHWLTGTVRNGRRLRGRTFIVPLANSNYEANGTLAAGTITAIQNAGLALMDEATTRLVVYGRPAPNAADGVAALVTGARVPDMAAVLRSRRD